MPLPPSHLLMICGRLFGVLVTETIGEQIWQLLATVASVLQLVSSVAAQPQSDQGLSTISLCSAGCYSQRLFADTRTHTDSHTYTAGEANSQWLMFGAAPLSALNNTEAQVLRSARDLQVCQMASTFAYSAVRMPQMAAENG